MSKTVRLLTPAVGTQFLKFEEDSFYEFVFDLESGIFTYKFSTDNMSYYDPDEGIWIPMISDLFGVYSINELRQNMEFMFDNTVDRYKFRSHAFDFIFYFKDESDMIRFKTKLFEIIFPEILADKGRAESLGFSSK